MEEIIKFSNISKKFFNNVVLNDVSFSIRKGELHALLGENGAGKSTLLNILHGVYTDYAGEIFIDDRKIRFKNANEAIINGRIAKVHQELTLAYEMTVGQNVAMGYEPSFWGFINRKELYEKTNLLLKKLGASFKSTDIVKNLSTGEMQMALIAKAMFHDARIISFDEPTSALSDSEVKELFKVIGELKEKGITIIYITHRLDEVFEIADRATVLRDGKWIATSNVRDLSKENLIQLMVGRDVSAFATRNKPRCVKGEIVLKVDNLSSKNVFEDISFDLHKGELLSFAGLVGSRRTDVMRAIIGADPKTTGNIFIRNNKAIIKTPKHAFSYKIGLIPENRKTQGVIKHLSNKENMALSGLIKFSRFGFIYHKKILQNCMQFIQRMKISPPDPHYETMSLSGGNQQKVVISKLLTVDADVYMFDEPTKGIDVGAKAEIYALMESMLEEGKSIIMVSSELPEVIGMSDRVIVMREGKFIKCLEGNELNEENILRYAIGG